MNDNQINMHYEVDEIDLKELITVIWKQKFVIISITLIGAIIAGIFSVYVLSPVYNTKLNIIIDMPENLNTKFGDYKLPISSNQQYINLITSNDLLLKTINDMGYTTEEISIESLRGRISIGTVNSSNSDDLNSYNITVSADNPEDSFILAETLYDNYIEFLDVMTKQHAIDYFYNSYTIQLKTLENSLISNQEILKKNQALLDLTPQTINQKEAMKEIQNQINVSDFIVLENIINPNYTKLENDVIINKQTINEIENSIRVYNDYLEELSNEKNSIEKYFENGKATKLESGMVGAVETSVYLPSTPIAPTHKSSPSNSKNVLIGAILGGMLGVAMVFIRYWYKKD